MAELLTNVSRTLPPRKNRVAVLGMLRSGKTALMISLINHLLNHDRDRFPIGDGKSNWLAKEMPNNTFPYPRYRHQLANGRWHDKTLAVSEYALQAQPSQGRGRPVKLELVDVPGERLMDLMIARSSYETWSDQMLKTFEATPEFDSHTHAFRQQQQQINSDSSTAEQTLIEAYRRCLVSLVTDAIPLVAPSTFLIDEHGRHAPDVEPVKSALDNNDTDAAVKALCATQAAGLKRGEEFAPLSRASRNRLPELHKLFRHRFNQYRKQIAAPLAKQIGQVDTMVVLTDIARLLSHESGYYNVNETLLQKMIECLDPGFKLGQRLAFLGAGGYTNRHATKIAFVASQADRVLADDHSNLRELLMEMTQPVRNAINWQWKPPAIDHFVCAAIRSTKPVTANGEPALATVSETDDDGGGQPRGCRPSRVPECWEQWVKSDGYQFPHPPPDVSTARVVPPRQIGLDQLATFILQ
jgi:predicted YcjX-like family ATPase